MGTIGKNKDNANSRLDIQDMGIRNDLNLIPKVDGKFEMPMASYSLTLKERRDVCKFLSNVKVPDGYSSNVSKWVNVEEGKILGMKSHDAHVFLQDLLAPTFRGILPYHVYEPLVAVSMFFKQLCSKALKLETLEKLQYNIARPLCKLEKTFLPSFFDVMVLCQYIYLSRSCLLALFNTIGCFPLRDYMKVVVLSRKYTFRAGLRTLFIDYKNYHNMDSALSETAIQKQASKYKKTRQFTHGKIVIEIPKSLRRVVGVNAQQFITEVGFMLKQICPVDVKRWANINEDVKEKLITRVKDMFDIPTEAHVNGAIKMLMMKLYRGWRYRLRRDHYLKYKTNKERLSNCPSEIDPAQWKWLVHYWGSAEFWLLSEKNAGNRCKHT